jgi:hypothetical protein
VSAVAYGLLFLFSPTVVAFGLFLGAWTALEWSYGRLFLGRTADPFSAPESEWPGDRCLFLGGLIRRRKLHDPRLERDAIRNWPMSRFWSMPEAIVLEAVDVHRELAAAAVPEGLIWEKLDAYLGFDEDTVPDGAGIIGYLMSRMGSFDRGFVALGENFVAGHVDICSRWLGIRSTRDGTNWPPKEWLKRRLSLAEFEAFGEQADPLSEGAPAVLRFGGDQAMRKRAALKVRMLEGDEIWSFTSPPDTWRNLFGRAGIVLIRDDRVVAHIVTLMN